LAAYFVLLFLFIICEFGVGGGSYALRSSIPGTLDRGWEALNDGDRNNLQNYFGCCGWANMTDSAGSNCNTTSNHHNSTGTTGMVATGALTTGLGTGSRSIYRQSTPPANSTVSCENLMVSYFDSQLYAVGTVGIVFATLQLVALISSIVVFSFIKVEQRRSQDERF